LRGQSNPIPGEQRSKKWRGIAKIGQAKLPQNDKLKLIALRDG
jgi:hypothetical protein